ncbi:MAG: helix-turn-helix transcriptional regulator [bacterium]
MQLPDPMLEPLGTTIRKIRLARGMTQQHLADVCGFERVFIIAIEKGRQNASTRTVLKLAAGLRVQPAELFAGYTKTAMRKVRSDLP